MQRHFSDALSARCQLLKVRLKGIQDGSVIGQLRFEKLINYKKEICEIVLF